MDVKDLEQRRNEHRDRADTNVVAIKPEERIAAQIDESIAAEFDMLIDQIRAKLAAR